MDPISITASTIALVEFGLKLVKSLEILRDLSHVPDDIAALIDELRDLQDVLAAVCIATKERASVEGLRECSDELKLLLSKTGRVFSSIAGHCGISLDHRQSPLQADLTSTTTSPPSLDLLTRFRWLKDRKRINNYRQRLHSLRLDIGNHLASLSLVDSCSVLSELRDLAAGLRKLSIDHSTLHATINQAGPPLMTDRLTDEGDLTESPISPLTSNPVALSSWSGTDLRLTKDAGRMIPSLSICSCSCHRVNKIQTPGFVQSVVGKFAVDMGGISMLTPACDEIACERSTHSSVQILYRFPPWFSNAALHSMVYSSRATGPQMSLSSTRIIARNSDIFCLAMQGNVSGVKNLFNKGLASPFDATNNHGYTALHYATDYGHYELCDFLLSAGAKAEIRDFDGRSSTDIAYHKMCAPSFDGTLTKRLRDLFDEQSWLEKKQFTTLHKIVLRLTNTKRSLSDVLLISTKEISTSDSDGRTPLSWAAEHGDDSAVAVLLKFGADTGKAGYDGNTPLHYACSCETGPAVLSTLLAAGADPTARNKWGQSPLNWASFHQNDPVFIQQLLQFPGVSLSEFDNHGSSALGNAAFRSNEKMLSYILDADAEMSSNALATELFTALLDCISTNNHASLTVVLEKSRKCGLDLAKVDDDGESCLHYLARRADFETVRIFREALTDRLVDPAGLHTTIVGKDGLTVRDLLALRGDEEVRGGMTPVLRFVEQESESEKSGRNSLEDVMYLDAEEFLPQLESEIGFNRPRIAVRGEELVSLI